jgi:hypothetical protein
LAAECTDNGRALTVVQPVVQHRSRLVPLLK